MVGISVMEAIGHFSGSSPAAHCCYREAICFFHFKSPWCQAGDFFPLEQVPGPLPNRLMADTDFSREDTAWWFAGLKCFEIWPRSNDFQSPLAVCRWRHGPSALHRLAGLFPGDSGQGGRAEKFEHRIVSSILGSKWAEFHTTWVQETRWNSLSMFEPIILQATLIFKSWCCKENETTEAGAHHIVPGPGH